MAETKPLPETGQDQLGQMWRDTLASSLLPLSLPPAPYLEASSGKHDFLQIQDTAQPSEAGQEQGMDIRMAHNVNISNPVP